ncbi:nucleotide exchange factor GrpE [Streptosporangium sp. H16]|uniref:nucleotide exchange factor GrpE n=1 Tax=Streptosporangium sp. H16 TaxID=3444184 RepID=UPI003F790511
MSETPGRGRHVPRRDGEPRGGYDSPGREPRDRGPYDREDDRERDAGREARAHDGLPDRPPDRPRHGARGPQGAQGPETRRGGQEARDLEARDQRPEVKEGRGYAPDAPDDLQERVLELQTMVADLQDRWRRALADLDNLRKRVGRDAERTRSDERARAAGEWLPVLDNLDRALEHAETDPGSIVAGMRAIRDQAQEVVSRLGYARRDDTGTVFDPARHEAVGVLSREGVPDGTVLQVVRPGYGDGEQLLRPALVVVAKGA